MTKHVALLQDINVWLDNYLGAQPGHLVANRLLDLAAQVDATLSPTDMVSHLEMRLV